MRKLNPREKAILSLTLAVITAAGVMQLIIKPLRENSEDINGQIEATQKRLQKSLSLIQEADVRQNDYQKLADIFGKSSSEGVEASMIVAALEAAAKEAHVHIGNMQPQRALNKGSFSVFSVDLIVDGSWASITKFIYNVQVKPVFLNIEEMNIVKSSDTSSDLRARLLLSRLRVN
jgi:hypothetical protein